MRIALVTSNSFYFPGGVQEHMKSLLRYLKSRGHYTKIIGPRFKRQENYGEDFMLVGRAVRLRSNASITTFAFFLNPNRIYRVLNREKFDILHFHNPSLLTSLYIAFKKADAKIVFTAHFLAEDSPVVRFLKVPIEKSIKRYASDKIDGIICDSSAALKKLPRALKGPKVIIPPGIDLSQFSPGIKKIERYVDGKLNLLFLGRIERRKGLDHLLRAYAQVKERNPQVRLIVAGGGNEMTQCLSLAEGLGLKDVHFAGGVTAEEKLRYLATADIFCSPALYGESFGIVLVEAMAMGKPIVAYANAGYRQLLVGPAKEFMVKPGDTSGLARKIETLLKDRRLRNELGAWGLAECQKYSGERVGREIENYYEQVMRAG
jgi:phosphatidylinositol alpha-mannosyltransferase